MSAEDFLVHQQSTQSCQQWIRDHPLSGLHFRTIRIDSLPESKGGVGWARKLVLDEAARILPQDGIMLCLDADCTVEKNYIHTVYDFFRMHSDCDAASIYYEHPWEGLSLEQQSAIQQYELHLRYLVHAMRWTGHPFAFQTVGSSMAVRRGAYLKQGGMNTRPAGEDFYFLQKFIEVDRFREIRNTTVYPSARVSERVPFGTGRAMKQLKSETTWMTTNMDSYVQIKPLFQHIEDLRSLCLAGESPDFYQNLKNEIGLTEEVILFLQKIDFNSKCNLIAKQTASAYSFTRRFFRYFNAFQMIRYSHFMRDQKDPDVPILKAAGDLIRIMPDVNVIPDDVEGHLKLFRSWDQNEGS
jgi:hypothetical protein